MTVNPDSDQFLVEYCEKLAFMLDDFWWYVNGPNSAIDKAMGAPEFLKSSEELVSSAGTSPNSLVRDTVPLLVLFPELLMGAHKGQGLLESIAEYGWKRLYDSCYDPLLRLQGEMRAEMVDWPGGTPLSPRADQVHQIIIEYNQAGKPITGPKIVEELSRRKSDDISPVTLNNLTGRIIPELKRKRGLKSRKRVGYYYPAYYKPGGGSSPKEA